MEAHSLSICIPPEKSGPRCDKFCDYCISPMTGITEFDMSLWESNIKKALTLSKMAGIANVMMTGEGEPLLNYFWLMRAVEYTKEFPVELQTNGIWLNSNPDALNDLFKKGLNVVAVSIDRMDDFERLSALFRAVKSKNRMLRICLNVISTKYISSNMEEILNAAISVDADQLLLRKVTIPKLTLETTDAEKIKYWIVDHVDFELYDALYTNFKRLIAPRGEDIVRHLPHGAVVYDYLTKLSVSFSDYCVQEVNNTKDIRSLILLPNGHVVTSWDKKRTSMLF